MCLLQIQICSFPLRKNMQFSSRYSIKHCKNVCSLTGSIKQNYFWSRPMCLVTTYPLLFNMVNQSASKYAFKCRIKICLKQLHYSQFLDRRPLFLPLLPLEYSPLCHFFASRSDQQLKFIYICIYIYIFNLYIGGVLYSHVCY